MERLFENTKREWELNYLHEMNRRNKGDKKFIKCNSKAISILLLATKKKNSQGNQKQVLFH